MKNDGFKKFNSDSMSPYGFFHSDNIDSNIKILHDFAVIYGIPKEMVERFVSYNLFNSPNDHLCDRNGNMIVNVYGAFMRFAKSGYDRTKWEEEHGIEVPMWLKEKRLREKANN